MLNIFFGDMENVIFNTSVFFDNTYQDSWFQDDFTKRVIKDIDKGEILGPNCVTTKKYTPSTKYPAMQRGYIVRPPYPEEGTN